MRFASLAIGAWEPAGASGIQTLDVLTPPSSFVDDVRGVYDGRIGGTLAGQWVAIPGTDPHYFWFSQADPSGVQLGDDPGPLEAGLAGYTGVQVPLANGNLTGAEVAAELETAAGGVYPDVNRADDVVSITGPIVAAAAFTGSAWAARGAAGLWGTRYSTALANDFATVEAVFQRLEALPGDAHVRGIKVFVGTIYVEQLRFGIYQGGASDTDPTGATLLHDFGQLAAAPNEWATMFAPPGVVVDPAQRLWLCVKGSATSRIRYVSTTAPQFFGDTCVQANYEATGAIGNNPAVAFPDPLPAGGVTGTNFMFQCALVYETPPFVGDGGWSRRFGVHTTDLASLNSTGFDGNVFMGGTLAPDVEGMQLDAIYIGALGNSAFRLGLYGGGVAVGDPNGATLIADLGVAPVGAAGRNVNEIEANGEAVPAGVRLWWAARDNASGPTILFDPLGANLVNPGNNPFDWPSTDDGEYETTNASPFMSTNPATPFEASIQTDASDITPGNQPFSALGLSVPGFGLAVG